MTEPIKERRCRLCRRRAGWAAIPLAAPGPIVRAARLTWVARIALAVALAVTLAVAFLSSRTPKSSDALLPDGRSSVVALDLSWSVSSRNVDAVGKTLSTFASRAATRLVLFSDTAYEALPAGHEPDALQAVRADLHGRKSDLNPWRATFSAGTRRPGRSARPSDAPRGAHRNGSVVLISYSTIPRPTSPTSRASLVTYQREGIPIRMVGINPVAEDVRYFQAALGPGGGSVTTVGSDKTTEIQKAGGAFPVGLVAAAGLIALLLALNEQALGRLTWGRTGMTRRRALLGAAAVCAGLAVVLALLSRDVGRRADGAPRR